MKRKKRFTIKLVALGLATAAITASPVSARLAEGADMSTQSEPAVVVSPDDRNVNLMSQTEANPIVSPDDRAFRRSEVAPQPSVISTDDRFEIGTLGMTGLVLLLGAAAAVATVYQMRKGRLASA